MSYIPEQRLTPPEPRYAVMQCGHELYEGESAIWINGKWMCPDCFEDYVMEMLNNHPDDLAEMMGGEVFDAERI